MFIDEAKGFLYENGVKDDTEVDIAIREAIFENHYAIENYLVESLKRRKNLLKEEEVMGDSVIAKGKDKPTTIFKRDEYKNRLKKKFPQIEDEDSLIMSAEESEGDGEMLTEAPITDPQYNELRRIIKTKSIKNLPDTWNWAIGHYVDAPDDLFNVEGDCPPIPKNKFGCVYKRAKRADGEPRTVCHKTCKIQPTD